jgi:hypothetical protein
MRELSYLALVAVLACPVAVHGAVDDASADVACTNITVSAPNVGGGARQSSEPHPGLEASGRVHAAGLANAVEPAALAAPSTSSARGDHARLGTFLGILAGTAAYAAYFMGTNCHYGSDSMSVLMTRCVVLPGAGFIGGGALVGRAIGKAARDD